MSDGTGRVFLKDKLIILIVLAIVIGGSLAYQLTSDRSSSVGHEMSEPLKSTGAAEYRGFALQFHNNSPDTPYELFVDEIAATGADTISMVVNAYQENGSSTSIFIESRKVVSDDRLRALIVRAHKHGLRVILMPTVLLQNGRAKEWRGTIMPANGNWARWWEQYRALIMHYAYIAQDSGVDLFVVGSELLSTESQTDRWRSLIKAVRNVYDGKLTYSANWDHFKSIQWWDDLDIIGMQCYHNLTGGDEPTIACLLKGWAPIRKDVLQWQKKWNRPILFTEAGWPNKTTRAEEPWNYFRASKSPAPEAQANCFEAFFQTWLGEPAIAGFVVWEWRKTLDATTDPQKDTSYVPCGKPAMDMILKYIAMPAEAPPGGIAPPD